MVACNYLCMYVCMYATLDVAHTENESALSAQPSVEELETLMRMPTLTLSALKSLRGCE